jgi:hypothetical protein
MEYGTIQILGAVWAQTLIVTMEVVFSFLHFVTVQLAMP